MLSRLHLSAILLLAALIWGAMLVIEGVAVSGAWFRPFSTVVGGILLVLVAFDLWAWRFRFLHGWFVPRPDIRGTWMVELRSDWKDPSTGHATAPRIVYLAVRQTFSTLSIRMMTAESESRLVTAEITKAADGVYRVAGVYVNEPKLSVRDRSPIHYGAFLLDVQGEPPKSSPATIGRIATPSVNCGLSGDTSTSRRLSPPRPHYCRAPHLAPPRSDPATPLEERADGLGHS